MTLISATQPPSSSAPLVVRLLSCIRFDEVLALLGPPLMGACFSIGVLTDRNLVRLVALVIAGSCLVAHIFVLNDWSGIEGDLRDPNRTSRTFKNNFVSRAQVGGLSIALFVVSLLLFGCLSFAASMLALAIAGLSVLYSAPVFHWKGRPLFGSALHLTGGSLHFLLGYATFGAIDGRGVAISCFFALVFTAGHLTQEACDFDGDLLNGIQTNAVAYGRTQTFFVGFALFTAAYALLITLALLGAVPHALVFAATLYVLHVIASSQAWRAGLGFQALTRLRKRYRVFFAIIGVMMVSTLLLG
jgi:4-hydroxybenzoate polyprenyltransferase